MAPELSDIQESLEKFAIVSYTDLAGNITFASDKFCEISKYSREELLGQNHRILKSKEHGPEFYRDIWETLSKKQVWTGIICNLARMEVPIGLSPLSFPIIQEGNILATVPFELISPNKKKQKKDSP